MKSKGQLQLLALFFSPIGLALAALIAYVVLFGGLATLNGFTKIFGVDIIGGFLVDFTRPLALILAFFVALKLIEILATSALKKNLAVNRFSVILLIGLAVFLLNFGISGKLYSITDGAPSGQSIDLGLVALGSAVGVLVLWAFLKFKTR